MGKTKNTIKINGHLYDATTGERVDGVHVSHTTKRPNVDGVISGSGSKPSPSKPKTTKVAVKSHSEKPVIKKSVHHRAPAAQRNVENSHTLMRNAVKKPSTKSKPRISVQAADQRFNSHQRHTVHTKNSLTKIDSKKLAHAKHIKQSPIISRFAKQPVTHKEVQATQSVKPAAHHRAQSEAAPKPKHDIFEHAIKHATSHTQKPHKKPLSRKQRISAYSALAVISVMLVGVMASQSMSGLKLHMASAKAGFAASLPGNKPAGYHLGQLNSSAGVVAMNYKSNSDEDRKFSITQKTSSWDSNTLRDLYVQPADKDYSIVETNGLTVFIYGDNSATWVNNGVWYVVHGNGSLSDNQLLDIAKSL